MTPARFPLLLLIPFLWLVRRLATGHFVPPTPLNLSLVLLLLMVLVSLYATFDLAFSLPKIAGVLYGLAVYFAVVALAGRSSRHLWWVVGGFIGLGLVVAAAGVVTAQRTTKLPWVTSITSALPASLSVVNPNEVAGVLLWIGPLALVVAGAALFTRLPLASSRRLLRTLLILAAVLAALLINGVILFTQSRSAILGLLLALVFIVFVVASRDRRHLYALVLLTVFAVAGGLRLANDIPVLPQFTGLDGAQSALSDTSLAGRWQIWTRAVYGIQDFAFTGMGLGTFRQMVHILYPLYLVGPGPDIGHAHNHLLQTGLDLGVPGLIAYLAIWLGLGNMLWLLWQRTKLFWFRTLALGLGASLLAYFAYGMIDAVALGARPGFLFWILLGLVSGLYRLFDSQHS